MISLNVVSLLLSLLSNEFHVDQLDDVILVLHEGCGEVVSTAVFEFVLGVWHSFGHCEQHVVWHDICW